MRKMTMMAVALLATPLMAAAANAQGLPDAAGAPHVQHGVPPQGAHGQPQHRQVQHGPQHQAMPQRHQPPHVAQNPRGNQYSWRRQGGRMPQGRGYVVNDYHQRHLSAPPRGYHWVRDDNNYMLVAISSGIISSIITATQ